MCTCTYTCTSSPSQEEHFCKLLTAFLWHCFLSKVQSDVSDPVPIHQSTKWSKNCPYTHLPVPRETLWHNRKWSSAWCSVEFLPWPSLGNDFEVCSCLDTPPVISESPCVTMAQDVKQPWQSESGAQTNTNNLSHVPTTQSNHHSDRHRGGLQDLSVVDWMN